VLANPDETAAGDDHTVSHFAEAGCLARSRALEHFHACWNHRVFRNGAGM
jgi:hypothetical protein